MTKRKKIVVIAVVAALVAAFVVSAVAVNVYRYKEASDSFVRKTVNRVDIEVSNTRFSFDKPSQDGLLHCSATVSIAKTQSDFYAVLDSITLDGAEFDYVVYTPGADNGDEAKLPENVTVAASRENGKTLEWTIDFAVPYADGMTQTELSINIDYTTGVKPEATQSYETSVPVYITVG